MPNQTPTIQQVIYDYIDTVAQSRSEKTSQTYQNGLSVFSTVLEANGIDPTKTGIDQLTEDSIIWMAAALKDYAPTTERLYLTAATNFFEYLVADNILEINLPRVRMLVRQRARKPGVRLPQFPAHDIEKVLEFAENLHTKPADDEEERLRNYRDRAFLLLLADSGLRVHEACNLRRGDIQWDSGLAIIIGKGDREAVVRFSTRSLKAVSEYLRLRATVDGITGRALSALPLFARHDRGAGKKIKPISTVTGRNIVNERVAEILGPDAVGKITPHSFRHFFVTRVLKSSGNLKLAQELARHKNIAVTQRYAHLSDDELDAGYRKIFENE